jgi:predicted acylesterase/phospholipase RssA
MTRRALFMATGANRGSWYAGFMGPLAEAGIEFELMAGVSAGGIASAWFAAGDEEALIDRSLPHCVDPVESRHEPPRALHHRHS